LKKEATEMEDMLMTMQQELQKLYPLNTTEKRKPCRNRSSGQRGRYTNETTAYRNIPWQADQQLQQKQQELMGPIFSKADSAISVVAKENNLLYVFDVSSRVVLYQVSTKRRCFAFGKKENGNRIIKLISTISKSRLLIRATLFIFAMFSILNHNLHNEPIRKVSSHRGI
jgi:hypothetical protein